LRRSIWVLLVVAAFGCAASYVRQTLRTETGRKRLLPMLRPLMRVINPRVEQAIERRESKFGIVHHVGRRSGAAYHTPVDVARTAEGVLISLPYGTEVDWCRNVLAADRCTITLEGEELALSAPEVVLTPPANAPLEPDKQRQWQSEGIAHYLSLKYDASAEPEAASTTTPAAFVHGAFTPADGPPNPVVPS